MKQITSVGCGRGHASFGGKGRGGLSNRLGGGESSAWDLFASKDCQQPYIQQNDPKMLSKVLEELAADYASGAMTAPERESFEILLEYQVELRRHVDRLRETAAELARTALPAGLAPSAALRARILANLGPRASSPAEPDALVVATPGRRIEWVNPAFSAMCGYDLDELRGRAPGEFLQGAATDPLAVFRMREALAAARPCRETLVNYHKDGSAYTVDVSIAPILDDAGEPLYFVARERRVADTATS